ncbi:MAG TPA: hypothetical protein VMR37_07510, partial [Rhabdochlamydiaceae bacterium]|nr:hypothetical protein [Rhabdochlamydiaceae bacterium]
MTISLVSGLRNTLLTLVANSNTPKALLSEWGIGEEEIKLAHRIIQPEYVIWSPSMLSPDGISKIQKPIPTRYSLLELFLSILLKAPNPRLQDLSQELIPCYSMQSHEIPAQPKCGIGEGEFEIVRRIIKPECVICTLPISMLLGIQILIPKKPIPTRDFLLKHFLSKRPNPRLQGVSQELIPCCPKQSQEIPGESEEAFEGRIPICKWEVNIETTNFQFGGLTHTSPKQVYLFREQDALTYQVFEPWSKTTWSGPIPTEGRPIEEVISYLMLCQPVMDSEGTPSFRKPFHKSTDGDTEVSIIRAEDRLVWHVYRTTQKRGRDIYEKDFAVFLSQTSRCTKETAACIRNIQSLPMQERLNSLRDFKIVSSSTFPINQVINLVFLQNLLPLNPFCFNLEPQVVEKSRLDE